MKSNESLYLSVRFREIIKTDLSRAFSGYLPENLISDKYQQSSSKKSRDRIFTPENTILTMLLNSIQEDKSLQNGLNLFKSVFESKSKVIRQMEEAQFESEKLIDSQSVRKPGRPKKYKSRLPKSCFQSLSGSTAGYATARKNPDTGTVQSVYDHSTNFGAHDKESWFGMKTYITDGTYLQLQDTEDIKSRYTVKGQESSYPQALLQVLIRQGSGQVSNFALGSRQESELSLIIPMIGKLKENSLLLADDLYNSYYHFNLILSRKSHIIVPGKRYRNYRTVRIINENDRIVEISKTVRPDYVSEEEWKTVPGSLLLRRITYRYPTKDGMKDAVLYTTVLDENIKTVDIIAKYTMRWDIEISIRETKTLTDINVLRSKSCEMLFKELLTALTAYNLVRRVIAESADTVGFSPQKDIFQKCAASGRSILLDRKGRVFFRWSPGRNGYAKETDCQTFDSASKR